MKSSNIGVINLIESFPYRLHQVRGPDGELVWVQEGINPDNVFGDKRKSNWPYSEVMAGLICENIAAGTSLSSICRQPGFPPYATVCRWRRENAYFSELLELAYQDRVEFYRDKVLEIVNEIEESKDLESVRLKISAFKWCAGEKAGPKKKAAIKNYKYNCCW